MPAVLFGSISTIADTSELQRQAFNQAFRMHGLDWDWDRDGYRAMLATSGGQSRVSAYAQARGQEVDAPAVHRTKSEVFRTSLRESSLTARPGVLETIKAAKANGYKVGFVTTTSAENVASLFAALSPHTQPSDFDVVVDASAVDQPKPDGAAYTYALDTLGEEAGDCIAVEDNVGGVEAATAAGVACVAMPNANTVGHDFGAARVVSDRLSFEQLRALVPAR